MRGRKQRLSRLTRILPITSARLPNDLYPGFSPRELAVFRFQSFHPRPGRGRRGGVSDGAAIYDIYILKAQNYTSDSSRQKYTNKEIKKDYHLKEYLACVAGTWK